MAPRAPVSVTVGGQLYRIVASVSDVEVQRLAGIVDDRIRTIAPRGKPVTANHVLLAAMALAHDLEEERSKRTLLESRGREVVRGLVARIDEALEGVPEGSANVDGERFT